MLPLLLVMLADEPAGGVRHAGLEIGGRGVKALVVEVLPSGVIRRLMAKTQPTKLTTLEDGKYRPAAIDDTARAMSKYAKEIRDEWKVPPERLRVVGSSGVPLASNLADLKGAVKKATGKELAFIDEKTEVALGFEGIIPKADRPKAVSLDIGGGNTKGGYVPEKGPLVYAAIPLGSVTYNDKVGAHAKKEGVPHAEAARKLAEAELLAPLKKGAAAMPELGKRSHAYLSGGMVWAFVSATKPEAVDRAYVPFKSEDVAAFVALVRKNGGKLPESVLDGIKDEGVKARAKKELLAALRVYPPDHLVAGAEILAALVEAFGLESKTLVFPRHGAHGWLTAYVTREGK
ncbi:MAG: hypothetical protein K2W96_17600 [Gemmataceae bacterium]|nr:hypothetical protein [Gemmataceae bacterium]